MCKFEVEGDVCVFGLEVPQGTFSRSKDRSPCLHTNSFASRRELDGRCGKYALHISERIKNDIPARLWPSRNILLPPTVSGVSQSHAGKPCLQGEEYCKRARGNSAPPIGVFLFQCPKIKKETYAPLPHRFK